MKTKFIIMVYIHMIRMCIIVDRHKGELPNLTAAGFNEAENWRRIGGGAREQLAKSTDQYFHVSNPAIDQNLEPCRHRRTHRLRLIKKFLLLY